jgi:hypothetical protein
VPLLVATFLLLPLPQWLRLRAADPGPDPGESYLDFYPRFFGRTLDVAGAKALGMRAVLRPNPLVPGYDVEPDATIQRLPELVDLLDTWGGTAE